MESKKDKYRFATTFGGFFTATFASYSPAVVAVKSRNTYSRYIEEILFCYVKYISNRY